MRKSRTGEKMEEKDRFTIMNWMKKKNTVLPKNEKTFGLDVR